MNTIFEILMIFFILAGYIGNVLTVIILKYERSLRSFTKTLLYTQALWDTLTLLVPGTRYLLMISKDLDIRNFSYNFKIVHWYFTYLALNCATWNLCALCLERMCLVLWPTNSYVRLASHKAALVISFIFIVSSTALHGNVFVQTDFSQTVLAYITLVFEVAIPFSVIFFTSFIILYKLQSRFGKVSSNANPQENQSSLFAIKTVLVVAIYYLITKIPFDVIIMINLTNKNILSNVYVYKTNYNGGATLMITNASIKFYLYNLSTPHMRKVLMLIVSKIKFAILKK